MTFTVGDKVLLSIKNLNTQHPSKKLDQHFKRLFKIINAVGKQVYTLHLP